jgi:hypothetical protein
MVLAVRLRYERTIHGVIRQTVHSIHQPHQHHHATQEKAEWWRWETIGWRCTLTLARYARSGSGVVMADSVEP